MKENKKAPAKKLWYVPILVGISFLLIIILIIGECSKASEIKALEEKYQGKKKELEAQILESEKTRLTLGLKIQEKDRLISEFQLKIESGKIKIDELSEKIREIGKLPPEDEITVKNCFKNYQLAKKLCDSQALKIIELEKQLKLFDKMVKEMTATFQLKSDQYNEAIKEIALYRMRVDSCEQMLKDYREAKTKLFGCVLGGGITSTGHFAIGGFIGVNPVALLKRIF